MAAIREEKKIWCAGWEKEVTSYGAQMSLPRWGRLGVLSLKEGEGCQWDTAWKGWERGT